METKTQDHEHHDHAGHDHHGPMPTSGRALDLVALSATLHCLTGCAIGEVTGMIIGTALGWSDWETIALAVALAFLFGYTLTSLPLLRAGLTLSAVVPIAFASDTASIAVMEFVDNAIMLAIPGAMEAHLDNVLFWASLAVALAIAGAFAFPLNRWLIKRGKGHTAVHETGIHGGPSPKLVGTIAAIAFVFGSIVLAAEAFDGDDGGHGGGHEQAAGAHEGGGAGVRGLSASEGGMTLQLAKSEFPRGRESDLRFRIVGDGGQPVRDYEVEHTKRMHLIVARRDLTGFQHLHPRLTKDGDWTTRATISDPGSYRVFADFKRGGENHTLATDLTVAGSEETRELPPPAASADAGDGYEVRLKAPDSTAGSESRLDFEITRNGEEIVAEDYLGAKGHLVALREDDMAYLHVHPLETGEAGRDHGGEATTPVAFMTEFPTDGHYRLFLQFKHDDKVRTAEFTREVAG